MNADATGWRELMRAAGERQAMIVLTTIASMEFDVRARSMRERSIRADDDAPENGPFVIEVHDRDWVDLRGVLNEIIAEQEEFDAMLEARQRGGLPWRRLVVAGGAVIGGTFVASRLLEL